MALIKLTVVVSALVAVHGVEFNLQNNCPHTIWVGIQGNIVNGRPLPDPLGGGVMLPAKGQTTMNVNNWGGRFWGRTGCDGQGKNCLTGDCTELRCNGKGGYPDVTLAEITTRGTPTPSGPADHDYYDVSHVDAHNLPMAIRPVNGRNVGNGKFDMCQPAYCDKRLLNDCPNELKEWKNGQVVACFSSCQNALLKGKPQGETDRYCCRGQFNNPNTCPGAVQNRYFKQRCPNAYSYAYDDNTSTFHCIASKYIVSWC